MKTLINGCLCAMLTRRLWTTLVKLWLWPTSQTFPLEFHVARAVRLHVPSPLKGRTVNKLANPS
jgi:hypothetical protein